MWYLFLSFQCTADTLLLFSLSLLRGTTGRGWWSGSKETSWRMVLQTCGTCQQSTTWIGCVTGTIWWSSTSQSESGTSAAWKISSMRFTIRKSLIRFLAAVRHFFIFLSLTICAIDSADSSFFFVCLVVSFSRIHFNTFPHSQGTWAEQRKCNGCLGVQ